MVRLHMYRYQIQFVNRNERERDFIGTGTAANYSKGYLKDQRYYNNTTHAQLHASPTLGIDGLSRFPRLTSIVPPN